MLLQLQIILETSFLLTVAAFSEGFNPFDPFKPFNPSAIINSTDLSEQCTKDVTTFSAGLETYVRTFMACQQSGGCSEAQQRTLNENVYAIEQLDAFGKLPPGLMRLTLVSSGSYSECMELVAPYKVQYCFVHAIFSNKTGLGGAPIGAKIAVCMPKSCVKEDIIKFLNAANSQGLVPVDFAGASCVPLSNEYTTAFWIYTSCLAFFVVWAILATFVDYILEAHYKGMVKNKALQTFLTYSVYSNSAILMNVSPHKEGTLKSLASIRFISMTWVVAGHVLMTDATSDTMKPVMEMFNPFLSTTIINAFLAVDTFFVLSGILVSYLFFKTKPTAKFVKNPMVWIMYYVHRYLRLTPPIMMFIGFYVIFDPFINGPWVQSLMDIFTQSSTFCKTAWWQNLLYINNFFDKKLEVCYGITWYLAVDTQLYFVAPVFLILLYISPIAGFALIVACVVGSVVYVYAITIQNSYPGVLMATFALEKVMDFFSEYYDKPWTRCSPYLIGIAVGYLLALGKKPKLSKLIIVFGWLTATAVALAVLYGPHRYIKGAEKWSDFVAATYNNLSRVGWALAVSWVVAANHLGWGGIIAKFMEHPLWQPLGRLSYCGYIVHFFIIRYVFNLNDGPAHYISIWRTYIRLAIPCIVASYVFAFFWSCLFEVPIMKLEKLLTAGLMPSKRQAVHSKTDIANKKDTSEESKPNIPIGRE